MTAVLNVPLTRNAPADSSVETFCEISESRHPFARLRKVKEDGLPGLHSPVLMVRAKDCV